MTRHITDSADRHPDGAPLGAFTRIERREGDQPHTAFQALHQRPHEVGGNMLNRFLKIERDLRD